MIAKESDGNPLFIQELVHDSRADSFQSAGAAGDAERGCELFSKACANCHGLGGVGSLLAPRVVGLGVSLGADFYRQKIRRSGPSARRDGIALRTPAPIQHR